MSERELPGSHRRPLRGGGAGQQERVLPDKVEGWSGPRPLFCRTYGLFICFKGQNRNINQADWFSGLFNIKTPQRKQVILFLITVMRIICFMDLPKAVEYRTTSLHFSACYWTAYPPDL